MLGGRTEIVRPRRAMDRRILPLIRRPGARAKRSGGAGAFHPSDLADVAHLWESDSGVLEAAADPAENGDTVEFWEPTIGSDDFVQSTVANRFTYNTAGGPNGLPHLEGASGDYMDATISAMSPPFHVWCVCWNSGWSNNKMLFDGISTDRAVVYTQAGNVRQFQTSNGAAVTPFPADSTWLLIEACFLGTASSRLRVITDEATGDCGSDTWVNPRIGASNSGGLAFAGRIAAFMIATAEITGDDLTNVRDWFASKYGVTV